METATAEIVRDLASPHEVAARRERIAQAQQRGQTRLSEMCEARATIRKHGIRTAFEFQTQLANLIAATPDGLDTMLARYRGWALKLACAIEDDMAGDEVSPGPSFAAIHEETQAESRAIVRAAAAIAAATGGADK